MKMRNTFVVVAVFLQLTTSTNVNICTAPNGKMSNGGSWVSSNRTLTRKDCASKNGTLIIKLLKNDKLCSSRSLKIKVGDKKPQEICKNNKGDCFIIQQGYYPCVDLSSLKNCSVLKWRVRENIYPVVITYSGSKQFSMNYTYIPCNAATDIPEKSTTQQPQNPITVRGSNKTTGPCATSATADTDTSLSIVFGILFAITLAAFIGYVVRQSHKGHNAKPPEATTVQPRIGDEEAVYNTLNQENNSEPLEAPAVQPPTGEEYAVYNVLYPGAQSQTGEPDAIYSAVNKSAGRRVATMS